MSRKQAALDFMKKRRLWIAGTAIVLLVLARLVAVSPTFQHCMAQQPTLAPGQSSNNERTVTLFLVCLDKVLDANSNSIVAAFTFVLAISTIALWRATRESVRLAQKTLTDLERPYVYAMPTVHTLAEYFRGTVDAATVTFRIKNIGRGPARAEHCICSATLVASEHERPGTQFRWEVAEFALGQGDQVEHTFDLTSAFPRTPGTIENIQRNFRLVYISPWVSYLDAAGASHDTIETWRLFLQSGTLTRVRIDRHT